MAMGAIKALHLAGKKVPDQISIVGYDDILLAQALLPTLTTVAQPIEELATQSTYMLIKKINQTDEEDEPKKQIVLKPRLIIRESTAPFR